MKARIVIAIAGAVLLTGAVPGFSKSVQKKANNQGNRIEDGKDSGRLTPKESERLQNQQDAVDAERAQAMEDGKMSKRERKDIKHDQKRLSHDIYNKKHNKQRDKHEKPD